MKEENWDVDVTCLEQRDGHKNEVVYGINVYRLPISRKRGGAIRYVYRYTLLSIKVFSKVTLLYFRRKCSIVQVHYIPDFFVLTSIIAELLETHVILFVTDLMSEVYTIKRHCSSEGFIVRLLKLLKRTSTSFQTPLLPPIITTPGFWGNEKLKFQK